MRYLIILSFFTLFANTTSAQSFSRVSTTTTAATAASEVVTVDGQTFTLLIGARGGRYMERTSSTGNVRKVYFGYPTTHTFEGQTVYSNKEQTSFWIFRVNRNGFLAKDELQQK